MAGTKPGHDEGLIQIKETLRKRDMKVREMPPVKQTYRISFFKKLLDSTGHPVDACQASLEIKAASQERAIETARQVFAEESHIPAWFLYADYHTVELLGSSRERSRQPH